MPTLYGGFHNFRLKFRENYKESIFVREWANFLKQNPTLLKELLNEDGVKHAPHPSERDIQIVTTVIQFLGTKEGQSFIKRVMRKCSD